MNTFRIRPDQLNAIKSLTDLDLKTPLGCAFKVIEETGELASALQGLLSLDGAHHRFITQDRIVEEIADITLASLSFGHKVSPESDLNWWLLSKPTNETFSRSTDYTEVDRWAFWLEQLSSSSPVMLDIPRIGKLGNLVTRTCETAQSMLNEVGATQEHWESMLSAKIDKWAQIQKNQMNKEGIYPFEIHITVKNANRELFISACDDIGVKPVILDLQMGEQTIKDVMTSSVIMTNNHGASDEMHRIEDELSKRGFTVVRCKIETAPFHPSAPSEANGYPMPDNCYFEAHIAVSLINDDTLAQRTKELNELSEAYDLHLSRNVRKKTADRVIIMATLRVYAGTCEEFKRKLKAATNGFERNRFDIGKTVTEFAIWDSNIRHDNAWMK
jgi:hypothetical protein